MATHDVNPATPEVLDDLLAELRSEGELDSRGSFTLDSKQARAKLQKFQLADPRRYVLELVQAAVLRGATHIDFSIDADDMHMSFDGRAFTPAELDDLWGSIFADGEGDDLRGLRQLALGLNAALGMAPKRIRVVSGTCRLELRPDRAELLERDKDVAALTLVHVEQRLSLGLVVDFLRNLTGTLGEETYLHNHCSHCPVPITLDGEPLAQGLVLAGTVASCALELPDVHASGTIAWRAVDQPAQLRLVKDGVWIDTHPLPQVGPGFVAVVSSSRLRKDVSLAKIVADDALSQLIGQVRVERWRLLAQVAEQIARDELPAEPALGLMRREVIEHLKGRLLRKRPELASLAAAITFREARTGDGQRLVSLLDIMAAVDAAPQLDGKPTLRHAYITYPQLAPEGPAIPQLSKALALGLGRMFVATPVRVDDVLDAASMRELNRRAWRSRTSLAQLPAHRSYVVRAPLAAQGVRGELGIRTDASATLGKLWMLLDGCELGQLERDWGVAGLDIVVEANFTPSERFDAALPNAELARACLHMLVALGPLLVALCQVEAKPEPVLAWLSLLVDVRARRTFLWERLGVPEAEYALAEQSGILPTLAQLRAGEGALVLALDAPLFTDCDGTARSLRTLLERCERDGSLAELPRSVEPEPDLASEVAWLDERQRWILVALLGEAKLRTVASEHALRRSEKAFLAKHALLPTTYAFTLRNSLSQLDATLWTRELPEAKGMIALDHGCELDDERELSPLRRATIELISQGRSLVIREFDIGVGPIRGYVHVEACGLAPAPGYTDVIDDEATLGALVELLREQAWALVAGLLARHDQLYGARRWFVTLLLTQLVHDGGVARRLPNLSTLPSVQTIDGGTISLAEIDQIVKDYGQLEWVPANTLGAGIRNPPIVRDEPPIIAALRERLGDALIDGEPRVRRHAISTKLESMPRVERAKLERASVVHLQSLGGGNPPITGEVGLSRTRVDGGLTLQLCTLGRRVALVQEPDLPVALEAIINDPELQLRTDGTVDLTSKQCSGHIRRCRRAIPSLIQALCKRYEQLEAAERTHARALLLRYVENEAIAGPGRREQREQAWEAARALPLAEDLWGRRHSLASLEARAKRRSNRLDVVSKPVPLPAGVEAGERVIVIVDAQLRACLHQLVELYDIEAEWEAERVVMAELGHAPELQRVDPRHVAWLDRKSSVAGGLEVHLWISRTPSPDDRVVCARANREVGRIEALPGVAMQGVLRGEGLVHEGGQVRLDGRQRASLAKQACGLLDALARQVQRGGKLDANAREQALAYLIEVDAALARLDPKLAEGIGKSLTSLRETLDGMIAPALRRAHARARAPEVERVEPVAVTPVSAEPPRPTTPRASEPVPVPVAAPPQPVEPLAPEVVLLTLVRAELEWMRRRHGSVIERLGLDRLMVGPGRKSIVAFDRGIVLQSGHPLIARMLAALAQGREIDPIDLTFAVAVIVGVMNLQADEIGAKDERAYLDQLAHSLRLGLS